MRRRFEYRCELAPATETVEEATARLNSYGDEGWQLVATAIDRRSGKAVIWLMREREEDSVSREVRG
jgi:hypothetical protein